MHQSAIASEIDDERRYVDFAPALTKDNRGYSEETVTETAT
jgi:hypothetical protein